MRQQVVLIELNEISFDYIRSYVARGELPCFGELLKKYSLTKTLSESRYEQLEPWIQWVTAHTGLTLAEHGVFRLGDILKKDIPQIWERLEARGCRVGAVSPMNAKNRLRNPAFFVPDPWTPTEVTGVPMLKQLYKAVVQAVGDNSRSRITLSTAVTMLLGLLRYSRLSNWGQYCKLALGSIRRPWYRAMFLDLFLSDVFLSETRRSRPDFASLFVNAGAHIQHHYMFSSAVYTGSNKNPDWYVPAGCDPLLDVYKLYDRIVAQMLNVMPGARIMLATGLHQEPHGRITYYWRLLDHTAFLHRVGLHFRAARALMSRDFLIECETAQDASDAAEILRASCDSEGQALFEVDNRGTDLFVMLVYADEFRDGASYSIGKARITDMRSHVVFVALKNGQHHGTGYLIDTGVPKTENDQEIPLSSMPDVIFHAVGVAG